jgi:hypothetical protein
MYTMTSASQACDVNLVMRTGTSSSVKCTVKSRWKIRTTAGVYCFEPLVGQTYSIVRPGLAALLFPRNVLCCAHPV